MGFKRKINTGDTADDYIFQPGNYTDLIWSYGEINSTTGDPLVSPTYYYTYMYAPDNASVWSLACYLSIVIA